MTAAKKTKGGEILAQALLEKGIDTVFSLCGGALNPVYEALFDRGIRVVTCRTESEAGHMADGWARMTRTPAVCLAGPEGATLTSQAMAEAFVERSPVIFISCSSILRRIDRGGFKEIDSVRMAQPVSKYSMLVASGKRIPEFVDKAYDLAISGHTGPVHLSIPIDIIYSSVDIGETADERKFDLRARNLTDGPAPGAAELAALFSLIEGARRPVLIAGHGVWWGRAEKAFEQLAQRLQIPLYTLPTHKKMFGFDSRVHMGLADIHQYPPSAAAVENADLFIVAGARINYAFNFGDPPFVAKAARIATINGSWEEFSENHLADHRVVGNLETTATALLRLAAERKYTPGSAWFDEQLRGREQWVDGTAAGLAVRDNDAIHPLRMCLSVVERLGEGDFLLLDGGDSWSWGELAINIAGWRGRKLAGVLHPGALGLIGTSVPFSNATKLLHPESRVLVIIGDGAMQASGLAVETALQHRLPVVFVVDNNKAHGMIQGQQRALFREGRQFGTELRGTPFDRMFQALGGFGEQVESIDDLPDAIERAFASGLPACINVMTRTVTSPLTDGLIDRYSKSSIE